MTKSGPLHNKLSRHRGKQMLLPSGSVREHFHDYCMSTSIHGVKYLGEEGRPIGERLWWLFIFIVSFVGNFYLIVQVWMKWNNSPVIVSFAETTTPVWQVPFPAITICPEAKARDDIFKFEVSFMANSTDDIEERSTMSLLCDPHILEKRGSRTLNQTSINWLIEIAPEQNSTLYQCRWNSVMQVCDNLFNAVFTEDGLCFTFNVLNMSEMFRDQGRISPYPDNVERSEGWTLDEGYKAGTSLMTYPRRAVDAGAKFGLFILLHTNLNHHDNICKGPIPGYKILLHNPAEIPSVGERYFRAPIDQEVLVAVQPDIMTTSDSLTNYAPHKRQCFFGYERFLRYFRVYTQRNCELECLTNYTLKKCDCVGLHMPHDDDTAICGGGNKECMTEANLELRKHEIDASYKGTNSESCDCLPACASLEYQAEISQANFNWREVLGAYQEDMSEFQNASMSRVSIFFKDMQFITSRRSELFGPVDFLANCGGLLGLFSGFSLLSLVEIIYYVTLRFWSNMNKKKKQNQVDVAELPSFKKPIPPEYSDIDRPFEPHFRKLSISNDNDVDTVYLG